MGKITIFVILCSLLLILPYAQGMSIFGKQRCRCNGRLANGVDTKLIAKFEVFPSGSTCDRVDIVVSMKSGKQVCINPNSRMVKNILAAVTKNDDGCTHCSSNSHCHTSTAEVQREPIDRNPKCEEFWGKPKG